jgi:hypothetical protein
MAPAPSCLVVAEIRSERPRLRRRSRSARWDWRTRSIPERIWKEMLRRESLSMIDIARRGWQEVVMLVLLLACETARGPSSAEPSSAQPSLAKPSSAAPSDAVRSASDDRSAAGAAASLPGGGGAAAGLNGGFGGAPRPTGSGASGMGGNDTGSGGTAGDGASGGSSGASGKDADPSSGDEERYALWLGPAANASAARDGIQRPSP